MTNIAVGRGNMGKGAIGHIKVWVMLHHVVYFLSIDILLPVSTHHTDEGDLYELWGTF